MTHSEYKRAFIQAHSKSDWVVQTSPMENDTYVKNYIFEDGAVMTEVNRPVYFKAKAVIEELGIEAPTEIKLLETECWNTDDATSYKFYERW